MTRLTACMVTAALLSGVGGCGGGPGSGAAGSSPEEGQVTVTDATGREVTVPEDPERVICSGPGCLRLLTYLQAEERAVAVDDMEGRRPAFDARPYAMANPSLAGLPVFGEFRGQDNPELILSLDPQPQLVFRTYPLMGADPLETESRTGIPVVVVGYGRLWPDRTELYTALRTMGGILDRGERAEEVIAYIDSLVADLQTRTAGLGRGASPSCYVGGIAYRGPHGLQSTEPAYPPLMLLGAGSAALPEDWDQEPPEHADVAREQIVAWDPDIIFVDASTMQSDPQASALYQLSTDPAYSTLSAVRSGEVYCLPPYNWYTKNFGSVLANAYFLGKVLYPERFEDIEPREVADSIYAFLVGEPVFDELDEAFGGMLFDRVELDI